MNLASQKAVIQQANMNLVNIRFIELEYFSQFFASFGTQSALMIGFIAGSLSQVPGVENPSKCWYGWIALYWLTSAICMGAAMNALVCSIFLQVYGQGLGLRGPLGSMVRAVEGMLVEQQNILWSFLIAVFSFGLQCVGMYWIMMDQTSAIVSSVFTFIGIFFWYHYALRLYNRFSWSSMKVHWKGGNLESDDENDGLDDMTNPANPTAAVTAAVGGVTTKNVLHSGGASNHPDDDNNNDNNNNNQNTKKRSFFSSKRQKEHKTRSEEEDQALQDLANQVGKKEVEILGGYLTLKLPGLFGMDPWQRRYFLIRGRLIYFYKDKRAFQLEPSKPINSRPIDLEGFTLIAGAREPPYAIALVTMDEDDPRKAWKFRCDTLAEFQRWIELFSTALKTCEHHQDDEGDMINLAETASQLN
jgi:hypothetical protein